ncbi:PPE family protein [Mycobacterium sp. ML4]
MVDYGALPPEINSGRIYTGPGPGPMLAAAAAWSGLAADLQAAASGHRLVITELTSGPWLGPASASMLAAATPFVAFLDSSAAEAEHVAGQAFAAAAAHETAFAASVPPPVIAANRALLAALVATNFLGQNTPAIAATEALYAEFWAQDAAAMYGYAGSSAAAAQLSELPEPTDVADPYTAADQAVTAFKDLYTNGYTDIMNAAAPLSSRLADVLKTLSMSLNGATIDKWLIANTPLDDIVPLYSKYLSPYVSAIASEFQAGQAFGQVSNGSSAMTALANSLAPAAKAVEGAAQAAGASAAGVGTKVSSVTAGLGRAVPLSGLSVPASWTSSVNAATGSGATALSNTTAIPGEAEGAVVGNTPVAPPFGQFFNAGNGRKNPAYGHRLTFMTRPPAAG